MNKTFDVEYRQLVNLAYDTFRVNTKTSNVKIITATMTNAVEPFQDDIFIEMLLDYCNKIKCDFTYEINNKTKEVDFTFKLREDSKYYFK